MSESQSKQARSAEDIQAEIEATRQRLADNLAQLKTETTPQALAQRAGHAAKGLVFDHETGSGGASGSSPSVVLSSDCSSFVRGFADARIAGS